MDLKIFELRMWADWALRTIFVGGVMFWGLFFLMQWSGVEVAIGLPTIEHTFKKK